MDHLKRMRKERKTGKTKNPWAVQRQRPCQLSTKTKAPVHLTMLDALWYPSHHNLQTKTLRPKRVGPSAWMDLSDQVMTRWWPQTRAPLLISSHQERTLEAMHQLMKQLISTNITNPAAFTEHRRQIIVSNFPADLSILRHLPVEYLDS